MIRLGMTTIALVLAVAGLSTAQQPAAAPAADQRAAAAPGANERLGQSYILMTRGEQAWAAGEAARAVEFYEKSLDLLESIQVDYPGWASLIVRSRTLACESAIEKIREGKPFVLPGGDEGGEAAGTNGLGPLVFSLSASSSETALKALKAGLEERDAALAALREELLALKKENLALGERITRLDGTAGEGADQTIPNALKHQARQWLDTGANSNAVVLLTAMKGLYPEDTGVRHLLGATYCRQGAFPDAVRELEPLVKRGRASADVWLALGVAYMGTGNLGKARQAFEEALERDASLAEAHFNMAQILLRIKKPDPDQARRHYTLGVQLGSPRDSELEMLINTALLDEQVRKLKR